MIKNFQNKLRELEPKHYITMAIFAVVFAGTIYGIYNYQKNRSGFDNNAETAETVTPEEVVGTPTTEIPSSKDQVTETSKSKPTNKKTESDLSDSGPETLYIPELALLSASGLAWAASKEKSKRH